MSLSATAFYWSRRIALAAVELPFALMENDERKVDEAALQPGGYSEYPMDPRIRCIES